MILFHIAKKYVWKQSLNNGSYGDFSIEKDGFIHCSEFNQLLHVANNNLKNVNDDLVVLCIDASRLSSEIKWETNKNNGMIFPHVYGLINTDSVIDVIDFRKNQDGDFIISNKISNYKKLEETCGAIIFHKFNDGYKVLLINFIPDNESIWGFPKGHIENNETEIQTAIREVKEEVGLDIKINYKFRESAYYSFKPGMTKKAVYYCAESSSTTTTLQKDEVEKTEWLNFEEAYNHLTYECDKKILMKFVEFFREHIR